MNTLCILLFSVALVSSSLISEIFGNSDAFQQNQHENLQGKENVTDDKVKTFVSQLGNFNETLGSLTKKIAGLEKSQNQSSEVFLSQIIELKSNVGLGTSGLDVSNGTIAGLTKSLTSLEYQIAQLTAVTNQTNQIFRGDMSEMRSKLNKVENKLASSINQTNIHLKEINSKKVDKKSVDQLRDEIRSSVDLVKNKLQTNKTQFDELEDRKVNREAQNQLKNELKSELQSLEAVMRILTRKNPCNGTVQRVSGTTVGASLASAPNGLVCIGNSANPSPNHNFLVFSKAGSQMNFQGTQSLENGFIDFTPYVDWSIPASGSCQDVGGCDKLPNHLRSSLYLGALVWCSKQVASSAVYLVCYDNANTLVDNDGAILVVQQNFATLWY